MINEQKLTNKEAEKYKCFELLYNLEKDFNNKFNSLKIYSDITFAGFLKNFKNQQAKVDYINEKGLWDNLPKINIKSPFTGDIVRYAVLYVSIENIVYGYSVEEICIPFTIDDIEEINFNSIEIGCRAFLLDLIIDANNCNTGDNNC